MRYSAFSLLVLTVNFKTYSKSNKLKKRLKNDPENVLIFKDTHEAIIDRKTFDVVQKHFAGRKRPDQQGRWTNMRDIFTVVNADQSYIFTGLSA